MIREIITVFCLTTLLLNSTTLAIANEKPNSLSSIAEGKTDIFNYYKVTTTEDTVKLSQLDLDRVADSLTNKVMGENRLVDLLDPQKVYTLPIGICKIIGGISYIVVLDNLQFSPIGVRAKAYMSLSFPGSSKKFGLIADNVMIGVDGIKTAQLKMLKNNSIDLPGGNSLLIKADSTFIEWDCNGYSGAQLSAELLLDENTFFKENPTNRSIINGSRVRGKIICSVVDFNDIILSMSLDPFQVKGLKEFSFYPKDIVLDLSDSRNAAAIQFPIGFQSALFDGANKDLWRGLYINSFTLKFPKTFAKNGAPPEITANNFFIDFEGITGYLILNYPLITLEQGNLGGWKFSINSFTLSLYKSSFDGFGMTGGIVLPITEQNKPLNYKAIIDANKDFLFQVTLPGNLNVPLFGSGSSITLYSNSIVTVESREGEFFPKALLNGKLNIMIGGESGASLADISFEGLTIQRNDPQVDIYSLSMQSGIMSGFPVQINRIALERDGRDLGLLFEASANLMDGKIQGATSFVVWTKRDNGNWEFKDLELRRILVDANTGPISIYGQLVNFKKDQVYGNGYFGEVNMSITPGIAVEATAQFGNVSGFRYWYADASLALSNGISVFPGFAIYGFGGGAYYHMQRNTPTDVQMSKKTNSPPTSPGVTYSGISYKPNKDISLGLKAKVIIGTQPSPNAFNGCVAFGLEFTSSNGLSKVYFEGDGRFMTEVTSTGTNAKVRAQIKIDYSIDQNELSGYADAFIYVVDAIKGSGKNNLAGRVEFYFAKSKWHIYIGTPSSPVNVTLMGVLTATSYFMVGTELPDFPNLPANVASLSKNVNFSNLRSESLAKSGGGFAFGASILASTGNVNFLIFYGRFDLGAGFDFMLKNFGNDAKCEGFSGPLGIDGWYAQGQAWAYVNAKIGVRVKVFRSTRRFAILDAGFAAALGAQLPNPTYLAGAVETHFSVLGGLVRGKCNFEFDYGTQCKLTNASAVEGIKVIAEITPNDGGKEVDVFITPQVAFNMPINQPFNILDTDGSTKSFRIALDYFRILDNDHEISSTINWNTNCDVIALKPLEILPGQKNLRAIIKVHFQVKESGGVWADYKVDGTVEGEENEIAFTTGIAPDFITENNVAYTYPVKSMVNFYKNEYDKSYIQLNQGADYLFNKPGNWIYLARFDYGSNALNMPITYNNYKRRVELNVPSSLLNNAIYRMRILRVPSGTQSMVIDSNVRNNSLSLVNDQIITTKEIDGNLSEDGVTELYSIHFRTSQFNSFIEKMSSLSVSYTRLSITNFIKQLHVNFKGIAPEYELFDNWEMQNIKILAIVDQTLWYINNYKNLIYKRYPMTIGMEIRDRSVSPFGVPPVWVSNLAQYSQIPSLDEKTINQGRLLFESQSSTRVEYNLCYYVTNDWYELRNRTFSIDPSNQNPELTEIKKSTYAGIYSSSVYPIKMMYYLPGKTEPTSEFSIPIYY
jgi:hypothetical protein